MFSCCANQTSTFLFLGLIHTLRCTQNHTFQSTTHSIPTKLVHLRMQEIYFVLVSRQGGDIDSLLGYYQGLAFQ